MTIFQGKNAAIFSIATNACLSTNSFKNIVHSVLRRSRRSPFAFSFYTNLAEIITSDYSCSAKVLQSQVL